MCVVSGGLIGLVVELFGDNNIRIPRIAWYSRSTFIDLAEWFLNFFLQTSAKKSHAVFTPSTGSFAMFCPYIIRWWLFKKCGSTWNKKTHCLQDVLFSQLPPITPYTPMPNPRALGFPLPMARQCVRLHPPSFGPTNSPVEIGKMVNKKTWWNWPPADFTAVSNRGQPPKTFWQMWRNFSLVNQGKSSPLSDDKKPCIVNIGRVFCILQHRSWSMAQMLNAQDSNHFWLYDYLILFVYVLANESNSY